MSRVLPNAMVAQAFRKLGIRSERLEADLPPMVALGLQKLYGFQHNDGGWGWWYDDSTDLNQTAYVLFGLAMTEQAGFDVDDGVMARGSEALRAMLTRAAPREQAYGAYVLAMAGQPVTITLTLTEALDLDLFSQAALAIALDLSGDVSTTAALLDNLREASIQDETTVHWSDGSDDTVYSRKLMGSTVRTTAMVADALARLDPQSPLLPGAVRWLMSKRQGQGWGDTQKTSFAILALSDYLLGTRELGAGTGYQIYVNDSLWQVGVLDEAQASPTLVLTYGAALGAQSAMTASETITAGEAITATSSISPARLQPGENAVRLVLAAPAGQPTGRLYYALTVLAYRAPGEEGIPAFQAHKRSIGVKREYRSYGTKAIADSFYRGDLVEVRLTLTVPEETWYVVVDDPLPAGFEALNERLGTTSHVGTAYEEPVYYWQEYGYNRKDARDERVSFFITQLTPGQHTYTYLARATNAGTFTALPSEVYPMYEPEVWSRSESSRLQIGPR